MQTTVLMYVYVIDDINTIVHIVSYSECYSTNIKDMRA